MSDSGQRIKDLPSASSLSSTDYIASDSASQGTRRVSYTDLADMTLDELEEKTYTLNGAERTIPSAINTLGTRIDNIITPSGSASLSELVDVRVNFLGETFASAGEAVRASDLIASGYSTLSVITETIYENQAYHAFLDTTNYKGGKFAIVVNTDTYNSLVPASPPTGEIVLSNSASLDDAYIILHNDSIEGEPHVSDYLDNYHETVLKTYTDVSPNDYRLLVTFDIPDNIAYRYIVITYRADAGSADERVLPNFSAMGTNWSKTPIDDTLTLTGYAADAKAAGDAIEAVDTTYTDANGDGNIVITKGA